jgi:hypothetical protein
VEGSTMLAMGVFNDKMAFRRVGSGKFREDSEGDSPEELERTVRKMKLFEQMTPSQLKAAVACMEHIVLQVHRSTSTPPYIQTRFAAPVRSH